MKKQIVAFMFFVVLAYIPSQAQKVVSGVKLDAKITVEDQDLILNGAGIREKLWFELYVGSLYVEKKSNNANEIINSKDAVAIRLDVLSSMVTSKKMVAALDEGLVNSTNNNMAPLKDKITKFKGFFKDEIKVGDKFILAYIPSQGVVFFKNGVKKGVIEGHDFKKALFGIWLCDKPADKDLKTGLLGK